MSRGGLLRRFPVLGFRDFRLLLADRLIAPASVGFSIVGVSFAVLKATNVDGVYTADPKKDRKAKRYDKLSHQEAIEKHLRVMDSTAFALARENHMPIIVFSIADKGAIKAVLRGKGRSTVIG